MAFDYVKFCGKSQILRTKNTCLFEQNFLNTNTESTKNSNISSQSNKNKRFIERANQSQYCKYVKLKLLFYTDYKALKAESSINYEKLTPFKKLGRKTFGTH